MDINTDILMKIVKIAVTSVFTIVTGGLSKIGANWVDSKAKPDKQERLSNEEPHFDCPFCNSIIIYKTVVCSQCEAEFKYIKIKTTTEFKREFAIFALVLMVSTCIGYLLFVDLLKLLNIIISFYCIFFVFCLPFIYLVFKYFDFKKTMVNKPQVECSRYSKITQKIENLFIDTDTKPQTR